jgi:hypothetical protein
VRVLTLINPLVSRDKHLTMRKYLIITDVGEGMPNFVFMVKAVNEEEARLRALDVIQENSYAWHGIYPRGVEAIEDIEATLMED